MPRISTVTLSVVIAAIAVVGLTGCGPADTPTATPSSTATSGPTVAPTLEPTAEATDSVEAWAERVLPANSTSGALLRTVGSLSPGVRTSAAQVDVTQASGEWTLQIVCAARRSTPLTLEIRVDDVVATTEEIPCGDDMSADASSFTVSTFPIASGPTTTARLISDTLSSYVMQLAPNPSV